MKIIGAGTVILVALTLGILEVLGTPYLLDSSCVSHKPAKANIRVINGRDADIHDNPWMVMIIERGLMKCGGSLIHPRYVLTAAHCTGNHPLIVRLGEYDLTNRFDCDKKGFCQQRPKEFNVSRVYSRQNEYHHNDIALLKLERNVEYRGNHMKY
ncbi:hypothetical protein KR009_010450 [Drosophila setifemur]|nr:hypothetical protein KR009_010450 [Drosophila setifemur]